MRRPSANAVAVVALVTAISLVTTARDNGYAQCVAAHAHAAEPTQVAASAPADGGADCRRRWVR